MLSLGKPRDLYVSSHYHGSLQNSGNEGQLTVYQAKYIKHITEDEFIFFLIATGDFWKPRP